MGRVADFLKREFVKYDPDGQMLAFEILLLLLAIADVAAETTWRRFVDYGVIAVMPILIIIGLVKRRRRE
jgi:hypothetical protein